MATPTDVFNKARVRKQFIQPVKELVERHCTKKSEFLVGSMLTSKWGYRWSVFGGQATLTPALWGQPGGFDIHDEEARAKIMVLLGIDLSRSRTYKKYSEV